MIRVWPAGRAAGGAGRARRANIADRLVARWKDDRQRVPRRSGGLSDKCNEAGWGLASDFIREISAGFGLDPLRVVLAPGNHDYVQSMEHFSVDLKLQKREPNVGGEPKPNERYGLRFQRFGVFYHGIYSAKSYREKPAEQFKVMGGRPTNSIPSGLRSITTGSARRCGRGAKPSWGF